MNHVDFKILTEIKDVAETEYIVHAYFNRGNYATELSKITGKNEQVFKRSEKFKDVSIISKPGMTRNEICQQLYQMLLSEKNNNDEVIPECIF